MKRKSNTKARPNEIQLFHLYPNGFVYFGKWLNYHRRMHGRHPLGCLHFGEKWLQRWDAAGRLLRSSCELMSKATGRWLLVGIFDSVGRALVALTDSHKQYIGPLMLCFRTGMVIRRWNGK